jgi:hypothetical protein
MDFDDYVEVAREKIGSMSEEDISKFVTIFMQIDRDNNGSIDRKEFKRVLQDLGQKTSEEFVAEAFSEVDKNYDSIIDFDEYLQVVKTLKMSEEFAEQEQESSTYNGQDNNNEVANEEQPSTSSHTNASEPAKPSATQTLGTIFGNLISSKASFFVDQAKKEQEKKQEM